MAAVLLQTWRAYGAKKYWVFLPSLEKQGFEFNLWREGANIAEN